MPRIGLGRLVFGVLAVAALCGAASGREGYYRFPALHESTLVFTAEGDLWRVELPGGLARRLTSHPEQETDAAISPDGRTIAFTASYEGAPEVYTMPLEGGLPQRRTWHGRRATVAGWTPAGEILYTTSAFSTLPSVHLVRLDPTDGRSELVPLAQAAGGAYDSTGRTLVFTRFPFHGSYTKRYRGGTAQSLWRFAEGDSEAVPLTADHTGNSREPMWWNGRLYFVADRDETMNLWSMAPDGSDPRQETRHRGWDVKDPSLSAGRIAYQLGADLRLYDIAAREDRKLDIRLASDFDQMRETWVDKPMNYLTSAHPSPGGDRVVLTARGEVFVAPAKSGRLVHAGRASGVRYRDGRFLPDGKSLLALSDEPASGAGVGVPEVEFWELPADGIGPRRQLSRGATTLRFGGLPSPDGEWAVFQDKNRELRLLRLSDGTERRIAQSMEGGFGDLAWSPDSRFLAYVRTESNQLNRIWIHDIGSEESFAATTGRFDDFAPAWSLDGKWLYFLSQRDLQSLTRGVWGSRQPEPYFDRSTDIFALALRKGLRSPFRAPDELHPEGDTDDDDNGEDDEDDDEDDAEKSDGKGRDLGRENGEDTGKDRSNGKGEDTSNGKDNGKGKDKRKTDDASGDGTKNGAGDKRPATVRIDRDGLLERIEPVPVESGNYADLWASEKKLFYLSRTTEARPKQHVMLLPIEWDAEPKTWVEDVQFYEADPKGETILLRKGDALHLVPVSASAPADLEKTAVDLSAWTFPFSPAEERRQMFVDAWRLHRDYFYDPGMHGVDWPGVLEKYLPLVDRITDRAELSDLLGEMVGELSVLHSWVYGGDFREGPDPISPAFLGARLERDAAAGGYRIVHIHRTDPDRPEEMSPLLRAAAGAGFTVEEGDVIAAVNGIDLLSTPDPGVALRHQADRQVRLRLFPKGDAGEARDLIVTPLDPRGAWELRYDEWEYTRRLRVEDRSDRQIGYVHLREMGSSDYEDWAREFYPVIDRPGLVIDLRNNNGGNIDSWILSRLTRRAWMWWQSRVGNPNPNMQHAYLGHMVVLVNEHTISDGEAFAEGFRRLGLGPVIGVRSWGGEVWLTSSNDLVDRGISTAAEFGVYGPEGEWLIEGHGVEPDIVVDNLPHATFRGEDAQLDAAVDWLLRKIEEEPVAVPQPPAFPVKTPK